LSAWPVIPTSIRFASGVTESVLPWTRGMALSFANVSPTVRTSAEYSRNEEPFINGVKGDVAPIIPLTGGEERVKVIRCRLQGKHRERSGVGTGHL
jgi:hypothetical protein